MKEKTCVKLGLFFCILTMSFVGGLFDLPFGARLFASSVSFILAQIFMTIPYINYLNNKNKKENEQQH